MRDEMYGRLWEAHHDQFSEWVGTAFAAAGERLRSLPRLGGAQQLFAAVISAGLTLITFTASAA